MRQSCLPICLPPRGIIFMSHFSVIPKIWEKFALLLTHLSSWSLHKRAMITIYCNHVLWADQEVISGSGRDDPILLMGKVSGMSSLRVCFDKRRHGDRCSMTLSLKRSRVSCHIRRSFWVQWVKWGASQKLEEEEESFSGLCTLTWPEHDVVKHPLRYLDQSTITKTEGNICMLASKYIIASSNHLECPRKSSYPLPRVGCLNSCAVIYQKAKEG